ncbi:hypothetical protein AVEN_264672-1 [Araneus ventricosus]|uniref:Uncharacterized protein n=1 Tax=Araneus ventricosus TaxID=182803 RepID=A0A4Y2JMR3_ARAVE|nr:hypothetical protein AVEN_264672-1 [Araneus ventricosus]
MSGINVEEYLTADGDLMVFEGVTEEDNPFRLEITDEMEHDDEEDDADTSQSLSTSIRGGASGVRGEQGPHVRSYLGGGAKRPPVGVVRMFGEGGASSRVALVI